MKFRLLICPVIGVLMTGCAAFAPPAAEQVVADRAQQRVDLLMAGEHEKSYQLTTPGYRSTENAGQYGTRWAGVGMWKDARVQSVDCAGETPEACTVVFNVSYNAMQHGLQTTNLFEQWVFVSGDWYFVQKF